MPHEVGNSDPLVQSLSAFVGPITATKTTDRWEDCQKGDEATTKVMEWLYGKNSQKVWQRDKESPAMRRLLR